MVMTIWLGLSLGSLSQQIFDCHNKCSTDFLGILLIIVTINIEMSHQILCLLPCAVLRQLLECRDNFQLSSP